MPSFAWLGHLSGHSFNIADELRDLYPQADTLFPGQTKLCVAIFQIGFKLMGILFQVDHPPLLVIAVIHVDIDAACTDIGIYRSNFFTKLIFIDVGFVAHVALLWLNVKD
jgi:hypothetical protein